jgi:SAM-dependent methyltransferase
VFIEAMDRHADVFAAAQRVLEIGAGQGWASCLVKATYGCEVVASDISGDALASLHEWEHVFRVRVDGAVACASFALPFEAATFDLVFCFQAAHHFGAHRRTLRELRRVLRPGGVALYLHEPAVPPWLHRLAAWRANRKRAAFGHQVLEDVLVASSLERCARDAGLRVAVQFAPSLRARSPVALIYFAMVRKLGRLQRLLASTADFVFFA